MIALLFPGLTILTAAIYPGIAAVVQGVVEIVAAIRAGAGRGSAVPDVGTGPAAVSVPVSSSRKCT